MDAAVVDRRPQAGGALFGCLEQVNAVGRCRDWTQAVQERFGWVKVFVWVFFSQGFGFTSSCFFRSSPAVQCGDEKHIILVLEFIIQLTLQAKKKKEELFKCHFQIQAAKRKQLIKRR